MTDRQDERWVEASDSEQTQIEQVREDVSSTFEAISNDIAEAADTAQKSGKSLEQLQTDTGQDFLKSEAQRRELFQSVVYTSLGIVFLLYLVLICWIFRHMGKESHNIWHIATILALPATTILFFLIKVLSKSPNDIKEDKQASTPAGEALEKSSELVDKLLEVLKAIINKN